MENQTSDRPQPFRLGIVHFHLPETSVMEKLFLFLFLACLPIFAILAKEALGPDDLALLSFFICILVGVLAYWMMRDPDFFLQFLLFPFSGRMKKWPAILTFPVRAFGFTGYLFALVALPAVFMPRHWLSLIIIVVNGLTVSFFVCRRIVHTWR